MLTDRKVDSILTSLFQTITNGTSSGEDNVGKFFFSSVLPIFLMLTPIRIVFS